MSDKYVVKHDPVYGRTEISPGPFVESDRNFFTFVMFVFVMAAAVIFFVPLLAVKTIKGIGSLSGTAEEGLGLDQRLTVSAIGIVLAVVVLIAGNAALLVPVTLLTLGGVAILSAHKSAQSKAYFRSMAVEASRERAAESRNNLSARQAPTRAAPPPVQVGPVTPADARDCVRCGAELVKGVLFCHNCGCAIQRGGIGFASADAPSPANSSAEGSRSVSALANPPLRFTIPPRESPDRKCPHCGTANPKSDRNCWRCAKDMDVY